jgi:membrane protein required for colicin V production
MSIAAWIIAAFLAYYFAPEVLPFIQEIPYIGPILSDSCELAILASFATVFAVALMLISFFTPLLSVVINKTSLNRPDQALGFIFGVLRGIALIAISFFAYQTVFTSGTFIIVEESHSARVFEGMANDIAEKKPEKVLGWLTIQYEELVSVCTN